MLWHPVMAAMGVLIDCRKPKQNDTPRLSQVFQVHLYSFYDSSNVMHIATVGLLSETVA